MFQTFLAFAMGSVGANNDHKQSVTHDVRLSNETKTRERERKKTEHH